MDFVNRLAKVIVGMIMFILGSLTFVLEVFELALKYTK